MNVNTRERKSIEASAGEFIANLSAKSHDLRRQSFVVDTEMSEEPTTLLCM